MSKQHATPLTTCPRLSKELGIELRMKRDDCYAWVCGGSKARKLASIMPHLDAEGCNAIVTTGGLQSNHARACALAAASKGWPCLVVAHGDKDNLREPSGNLLLMRLAGAIIRVVTPDRIAAEIDSAVAEFNCQGYHPCIIPGGGHCLWGSVAMVEAVSELESQCRADEWIPDWIVLASGTGTTQAGLVAGIQRVNWHSRVVGISIARSRIRGEPIVREALLEVCTHYHLPFPGCGVDFRDEWIGDGYGKASPRVEEAIRLVASLEGIILDPTYTGKAFAGLMDLVSCGEIGAGSRVLFWHTGGLLNLMGTRMHS